MCATMTRHFKIGTLVGQGFQATNGILQGCPLFVVLLNVLMQIWRKDISSIAGVVARCYADDATATAETPRRMQQALRLTEEEDNA